MNRCWSLALLAPLLAGCVAAPAPRHADTVEARADTGDTDAAGDTEDTDVADVPDDTEDTIAPDDGLVGVRLDPPLESPAFLVENQRREARTPDWLLGDPSVVWFFRDAGST